jgi:hypothetical protein
MKFKNIFIVAVLVFAVVSEPILAQSSRRSSLSSSSRSSSSSSRSFSGGSSSRSSSSGWGSSSKSSDSSSKSYSSGSSGWGGNGKKSDSGFSGGSSESTGKSSGFAPNNNTTKKDISSDSSSSTDSINKKSTGWGSSSGSIWGNNQKLKDSSGSTSYKAPSKGDVALERKAIQSGTAYKTKDAAMSDFKSKYADKYPNKFTSEPSTRPDYIPRTYSDGGSTYNIVYNNGFGGYGYYNALGVWMTYNIMTDAIMMNSLMHRHNYYYPSAPYGGTAVVHTTSSGIGFFWGFMMIFGTMFLIFFIAWIIASKTD